MDRRAWQATLHGVAKSWTQLNHFHFQDAKDGNQHQLLIIPFHKYTLPRLFVERRKKTIQITICQILLEFTHILI